MAEILSTLLATSEPLTICYGFYMFPSGSGPFSPQDTMHGSTTNTTLVDFNTDPTIFSIGIIGVDIPITLKIVVESFMGFCGPAFAMGVTVTGQTFDATDPNVGGVAIVEYENGQAQGGFGLGYVLGFTFDFSIGLAIFYGIDVGFFKIGGSFSLFTVGFSLTVTFDMLQFVMVTLENLYKEGGGGSNQVSAEFNAIFNPISPPPPNFFPSGLNGIVIGFFDQTNGPSAMDGGQLQLNPKLNFILDLTPFIPPLPEFTDVLSDLGGSFIMGPQLTITFPININVASLIADTATYSNPVQVSANSGDYQEALGEAAIAAYNAKNWIIPDLPDLLAIAGRTVQLGIYPDITHYLNALITAANGTIPQLPSSDTNLTGNGFSFTGGPATAARTITNITAQFTHTTGVTVTVSLAAAFSFFGLNISYTSPPLFSSSDLFGPITFGPFTDQLTNTNGAQFVAPVSQRDDPARLAAEQVRDGIANRFVDVVFDPVAS